MKIEYIGTRMRDGKYSKKQSIKHCDVIFELDGRTDRAITNVGDPEVAKQILTDSRFREVKEEKPTSNKDA